MTTVEPRTLSGIERNDLGRAAAVEETLRKVVCLNSWPSSSEALLQRVYRRVGIREVHAQIAHSQQKKWGGPVATPRLLGKDRRLEGELHRKLQYATANLAVRLAVGCCVVVALWSSQAA